MGGYAAVSEHNELSMTEDGESAGPTMPVLETGWSL